MKHFLAWMVLFAGILTTSPAVARLMDFAHFSIDLPPGWTIREEGVTVAFIAKDASATMAVTTEITAGKFFEGMSAEELARAYASELKGSEPTREDNDPNYYSFDFTSPEGVPSEASIVVSGRRFYLITISGTHKDMAGMVESVLVSLP